MNQSTRAKLDIIAEQLKGMRNEGEVSDFVIGVFDLKAQGNPDPSVTDAFFCECLSEQAEGHKMNLN